MKTAHLWSFTAGAAAALSALSALRADPASGAPVVLASYWISGDDYARGLDGRIPGADATFPRAPAAPAEGAATSPLGAGAAAELRFDSPVFTAHPLGWDDPAAPSIPRLPPYNVTDRRIREIQPPELYTRQGMVYQSFKRYPGLAYGNFFHSNEHEAYEMYLQDRWNATKADLWQTAFSIAAGGDPKEGRLISQEVYDEDLEMRAESSGTGSVPEPGQLQFGSQNADTKVLEIIPIFPFDVPIVHVRW